MHNYQELRIWNLSMELVVEIYKALKTFPDEERFGLCSQLRRSAVSIPSNIAEGAGRSTAAQFRQFVEIAMGSCNEVRTQLEIASRLGFIENVIADGLKEKAMSVYKMMHSFRKAIK